MSVLISSLGQGLTWTLLAIGVYLTYRLLDIADLSAEGTFPLGAVVSIKLIVDGHSAVTASIVGFVAGMLAGTVTGLIHTKLHIPALLAGILTMTGLYSVNLHILGRANVALPDGKSLYDYLPATLGIDLQTIMIGGIVTTLTISLLVIFFKSELGLSLRATGGNRKMSQAQGIKTDGMIILGYAISNGLIALAGALVAQSNGYADVGMGIGTIVIGLASVLVGELILDSKSVTSGLVAMLVGAVVYRLLLTLAMTLGINPVDMKIFSAVVLLLFLVVPVLNNRRAEQQNVRNYLKNLE